VPVEHSEARHSRDDIAVIDMPEDPPAYRVLHSCRERPVSDPRLPERIYALYGNTGFHCGACRAEFRQGPAEAVAGYPYGLVASILQALGQNTDRAPDGAERLGKPVVFFGAACAPGRVTDLRVIQPIHDLLRLTTSKGDEEDEIVLCDETLRVAKVCETLAALREELNGFCFKTVGACPRLNIALAMIRHGRSLSQ
jgi:hypothetical protein